MSKLVSIHKALQLKKDASREEFDIWCLKYKAVARNMGHLEIMIGTDSVPTDTTDSKYKEKKTPNQKSCRLERGSQAPRYAANFDEQSFNEHEEAGNGQ